MKALAVTQLTTTAGAFRLGPLDLQVEAGEYVVLMGATGSGKSLLVKLLCGLIRPQSGSIQLFGQEVTALAPRRRGIGYVPQTSALFPHLSVARNITFAGCTCGQRPALALAAAAEIIDTLKVRPLLERRPTTLSGGERQKVALARALCARPQLLLLDEPVSALDEPTRREVCAALKDIHRRFAITTVHVCHSLDETRSVATQVGIMEAGRVLCVGTLPELQAAPPPSLAARRLLGLA